MTKSQQNAIEKFKHDIGIFNIKGLEFSVEVQTHEYSDTVWLRVSNLNADLAWYETSYTYNFIIGKRGGITVFDSGFFSEQEQQILDLLKIKKHVF